MSKRKQGLIKNGDMPTQELADVESNIYSEDSFFVATPDITDLGYNVIEWLHENPDTKDMTNAEWCAILALAIFNLGFDIASAERKGMHYDVMNRLTKDNENVYVSDMAKGLTKMIEQVGGKAEDDE